MRGVYRWGDGRPFPIFCGCITPKNVKRDRPLQSSSFLSDIAYISGSAPPTSIHKNFLLYDDDYVKLGIRKPPRTLPYKLSGGNLIFTAFADSFIEPIKVPSQYVQLDVEYARNLDIGNYLTEWKPKVTAHRDLFDSEDFWVSYLLCAWQPALPVDHDPDSEFPFEVGQSDLGTYLIPKHNFGAIYMTVYGKGLDYSFHGYCDGGCNCHRIPFSEALRERN